MVFSSVSPLLNVEVMLGSGKEPDEDRTHEEERQARDEQQDSERRKWFMESIAETLTETPGAGMGVAVLAFPVPQ